MALNVNEAPRPTARGAFAEALRELTAAAGSPSVRLLAAMTGDVSHTTVAQTLQGKRLPPWPTVRAMVMALGGDEPTFRRLWNAAVTGDPAAAADRPPAPGAIAQYKAAVERRFSGLDIGVEDRTRVDFDAFFVPRELEDLSDSHGRRTKLLELPERSQRAVILGEAGSGKTTACVELMRRWHKLGDERAAFLVALRDFAGRGGGRTTSVTSHLRGEIEGMYQTNISEQELDEQLRYKPTLVIFDGLDEVLDGARRQEVASVIEIFSGQYASAVVVVTSRRVGYAHAKLDPASFSEHVLADLDLRDGIELIERWTRARGLGPVERTRLTQILVDHEHSPHAYLWRNPLLITLLCNIVVSSPYLPQSRLDLLERAATVSLETWDRKRGIHAPDQFLLRLVAGDLALWLLDEHKQEDAVPEGELRQRIAMCLQGQGRDAVTAGQLANELVEHLGGRAELIADVGTTTQGSRLFAFSHRMFLEYFAATQLASIADSPRDLAESIAKRLVNGHRWTEMFALAIESFGRKNQGGGKATLDELVYATGGADRDVRGVVSEIVRVTSSVGAADKPES